MWLENWLDCWTKDCSLWQEHFGGSSYSQLINSCSPFVLQTCVIKCADNTRTEDNKFPWKQIICYSNIFYNLSPIFLYCHKATSWAWVGDRCSSSLIGETHVRVRFLSYSANPRMYWNSLPYGLCVCYVGLLNESWETFKLSLESENFIFMVRTLYLLSICAVLVSFPLGWCPFTL